jgi:hypothetical protein
MFGIGQHSLVLFRLTLAVYAVVCSHNAPAFTTGRCTSEVITIGSFSALHIRTCWQSIWGTLPTAGDF